MKSIGRVFLMLLVGGVAFAETHTMTLWVTPPTHNVDGTEIQPGGIIGYWWFVSDEPFDSVSSFVGEPIETTVTDTDDATELPVVHEFDDSPANHSVYATAVVRGWGGLDSAPFIPIAEIPWEVVQTPAVTPNPPSGLRADNRQCETVSWQFTCVLLDSETP